MKVMLRLRDLTSGTAKYEELESLEKAEAWLRARPKGVEVEGVVFDGLTREQNDSLKAAMRPLDDEEKAAQKSLDEAAQKAREERAREQAASLAAEEKADLLRAATMSPSAQMVVRYHFLEGVTIGDRNDKREVTEAAREAALAWVAERNEWVEDRGQCVGEATIHLFPAEIPKGKSRIVSGTFVPVSKPSAAGA